MASKSEDDYVFKLPPDLPTLGEMFFVCASEYANNICHIDANTDISESFDSVKARSIQLAVVIQSELNKGDVVVICSSNSLDNPIAQIALFYLGVTVGNLDPSLSVQHVRHLCTTVVPKMIFVSDGSVDLIEDALKGTSLLPRIVVFGQSAKYQTFSALIAQQPDKDFELRTSVVTDPAILIFSSGTTGVPKAIIHTHGSTFCMAYAIPHFLLKGEVNYPHVYYHLSSFYWISGIMSFISAFMYGHTRVFSKNLSDEEFYSLIEKYKVSNIFLAPMRSYKFTRITNWQKYNTTCLKNLIISGGAISAAQLENLIHILKDTNVYNGYGTSETGAIAMLDYRKDTLVSPERVVSCGKPSNLIQFKIVDPETEKILGPNQNGEIRIKSPSIMTGYYNLPSTNAFDREGFVKTGDIGYFDTDGYIYVVDRLNEVFKYQSWQIKPSVIETVLLDHPGISRAVVFGIPHPENGDVPTACVVPKPGVTINAAEVVEFVAEKVLDREQLRGGVFVVDKFPMTPSGKIMRIKVKEDVIKLMKNK